MGWELIFSIPKTLYFNFKCLPFKSALKTPFLVAHNVKLVSLAGHVAVSDECLKKRGSIKIGFGNVDIFDRQRSRTIWKNKGTVIFNGRTFIGHGSKLGIAKGAVLKFGRDFTISAESQIVCKKSISFGNRCLLSWDILIMDSDFHQIISLTDKKIFNEDREINIGDNVWIGARSMVKKNINLADNTIIAAQSVVVKSVTEPNQIWGGNPAKMLKENVMKV